MSDDQNVRRPEHLVHRTRARAAVISTVAGMTFVVAAGVLTLARGDHGAPAHAGPIINVGSVPSAEPAATSPSTRATPVGDAAATTAHRSVVPAVGATLRIPRVNIEAPVVGVGVRNGILDVPLDPRTLGWWIGSAEPGSGTGSVVIDGHINYSGVTGALAVLPDLRVGDTATLTRGGQTINYHVTAARTYPKSAGLPPDVFTHTGPERLVLITCGGPFDASSGNYEDNIVVYASP